MLNWLNRVRHSLPGLSLLLVLVLLLVACGQEQTDQETGDADVSEEAADVAQESEELAGAAGEELEEEAQEAGTAAAQTGQELEEELDEGAQEAGTAAAQTGEELEEGAQEAGTAAAQTGEELEEEVGEVLPQELTDVEGVTVSELDDNIDAYVGQEVGVRGDITNTIGTNAFQLNDPATLGGDEILVVGSSIDTSVITPGHTVEVSGGAYRVDLATVENESGLDLQDDLFTEWDDDTAVLVAQDVVNVSTE